MNQNTIHIGLCADEKYAMYLGVCITSIFENNKANEVCIHVLTQGFSEKSENLLRRTAEIYGQTLKFYSVDESLFDDYPMTPWFPQSIYFRYLLPQVLPTEIKKVLYLDSDTIILGDLKELWNIDLKDCPLGVVPEAWSELIHIRNRIEIYDGSYFNSGVLLMNLEQWRANDYFRALASFIHDNPEKCVLPDQDALNVIFHDNVTWLSFRYNFQMILCEQPYRYHLHKRHHTDVIESFSNMVVLHYATYDQKPWYASANHPLIFVWRYYLQKSLWKNRKLIQREGFFKRNLKKLLKKGVYSCRASVSPELQEALMAWEKKLQ